MRVHMCVHWKCCGLGGILGILVNLSVLMFRFQGLLWLYLLWMILNALYSNWKNVRASFRNVNESTLEWNLGILQFTIYVLPYMCLELWRGPKSFSSLTIVSSSHMSWVRLHTWDLGAKEKTKMNWLNDLIISGMLFPVSF